MVSLNKIMLVDDDQITNHLNKRILSYMKCAKELVIYNNPIEALDYLKRTTKMPELLFLDINMPEMNGWQFLEEYNQNFAGHYGNGKIVLLTASELEEDYSRAINFGIESFLHKPLTENMLLDVLEKHCPVYFN